MAEDHTKKFIDHLVTNNKVMLFMKGNKIFPQCGFSAAVVEVLKKHEVPFEAFNVLSDMNVREGIKEYAEWPTIPQLYVNGEFVGGCDIIREMDATGELVDLFASVKPSEA
ncbi:MAG: Grx4 family monothiol glutaredoxin [Myxococcota bacterium]